jgi:hypothetical protein
MSAADSGVNELEEDSLLIFGVTVLQPSMMSAGILDAGWVLRGFCSLTDGTTVRVASANLLGVSSVSELTNWMSYPI